MSLRMCRIFNSQEFTKTIESGPIDDSYVNKSYFHEPQRNNTCKYYQQVIFNHSTYAIGMYFVLSLEESEAEFGEIVKIISVESDLLFEFRTVKEVSFDSHVHGYVVRKTKAKKLVNLKELPDIAHVHYVEQKETGYIIPRYIL
ncbi:hypothetical protein QAD02_010806 [Eretmocerus hayati]|uniref:Uncharacterized protein n=1 Tax=Eretmocerus hayati TaxID=131215 RepID=A0ACC2NUZ7_9HYME|nr:hypothetical protein QAD02_010806 [Eretmocerus hayati]